MDEFLPAIDVPSLVVYADHDPVVSVKSAPLLMEKLGGTSKKLRIIQGNRHGILMENFAESWNIIDEFLSEARASGRERKVLTVFHPPVPSNEKIRCE